MNVNVNLVPRKKGFIKKIIILILFAFLCFFIKENVFAIDTINLYDLTLESEFTTGNCISNFTNYPDFVTKFGFKQYASLSSEQCSLIIDAFEPYEYIGKAIDNGYEYYVISYNHQINHTTGYDYGNQPTIYFFKSIPKLEISTEVYNKYVSQPSYETTSSNLIFVDYGSDILSMNTYKNSVFFTYDFSNAGTVETTIDTETNKLVESQIVNSFVSNFDLYTTDGELISSASDITFEVPKDNVSWFQKILNGILSIPEKIGSFFQSVGNFIVNGIKDLFVPGDELEGFFEDEYDYIKTQLGFLTYPIEIVFDFANRFYELDDTNSAVFKIPKLEVFNHTIYEGTKFDLMSIVNGNDNFKYLYSIYKIVVSALIVLWLVNLAVKKEDEIFGSGGGLN